jgi:predicted metal-dependent hydrolase
MIQLAAAFHHYTRGNLKGTKSLLETGLNKLREFPREYRRTNVHVLRRAIDVWLEAMTKGRSMAVTEFPQIECADPRRRNLGI